MDNKLHVRQKNYNENTSSQEVYYVTNT